MEYGLALKWKKILAHAITWMITADIMLTNEVPRVVKYKWWLSEATCLGRL